MVGEDRNDNPGVVAPPPLIYALGLALGIGLDAIRPLALVGAPWSYWIGGGLIALGVAGMAACLRRFRRAGTHVETRKPTRALVVEGPYRYSRNPIYVSLGLLYAGIAFAAGSAWMLAMLVPVLLVVRYGVIAREERYLEGKFGASYRSYRSAVRRWL